MFPISLLETRIVGDVVWNMFVLINTARNLTDSSSRTAHTTINSACVGIL